MERDAVLTNWTTRQSGASSPQADLQVPIPIQEELLKELAVGSKTPWNFPGNKNDFCSDEAVLGGLLEQSWSPVRQSRDQKLRTSSPTSPVSGEGLEIELMISHAYSTKLL